MTYLGSGCSYPFDGDHLTGCLYRVSKLPTYRHGSRFRVSLSGGGVFLEKLGRGVRPSSQNPYPIYDQNLRLSLPY